MVPLMPNSEWWTYFGNLKWLKMDIEAFPDAYMFLFTEERWHKISGLFLKQVDTLVNLSVHWNCLGAVWICARLVRDMPWLSMMCLAKILLVLPTWWRALPFVQDTRLDTQRAVGYKSRHDGLDRWSGEAHGDLMFEETRNPEDEWWTECSHTHCFRDSQGNFKFVCLLSMNLRISVLCVELDMPLMDKTLRVIFLHRAGGLEQCIAWHRWWTPPCQLHLTQPSTSSDCWSSENPSQEGLWSLHDAHDLFNKGPESGVLPFYTELVSSKLSFEKVTQQASQFHGQVFPKVEPIYYWAIGEDCCEASKGPMMPNVSPSSRGWASCH